MIRMATLSSVFRPPRWYRQLAGFRSRLGVGPVEVVEDPVGVLEREMDPARIDVDAALAAVAAFPDEPFLEHDGDAVVLAGDGVLERGALRLAHTAGVDITLENLDQRPARSGPGRSLPPLP